MLGTLGEALMIILMTGVVLAPVAYLFNRSRYPLAEAAQRSGCPEQELQALIKEKLLNYRRKYLLFGPYSIDVHEIARARAGMIALQNARAEADAIIRKAAEAAAAQINESNRRFQEQQEELERMRRAHAEILARLRANLGIRLIPEEVAKALHILELPRDASFDDIRQRYRLLAKQHHPDTGGDPEQFKRIDVAYKCVIAWIQRQG